MEYTPMELENNQSTTERDLTVKSPGCSILERAKLFLVPLCLPVDVDPGPLNQLLGYMAVLACEATRGIERFISKEVLGNSVDYEREVRFALWPL